MTTPQPAALPENACPKCGAISGNDWSQCNGSCPMYGSPHFKPKAKAHRDGLPELPEGTQGTFYEPGYTADQMRAYALAALQPQPAAAVSDEEIVAALEAAGVKFQRFMGGITGTKDCWSTAGSQDVRKLLAGVRAILALRPQAVPMPEPVQRLSRYAGQTMRTARNPNITAREAIEIGDYLAAIGITAQGAQGEQG